MKVLILIDGMGIGGAETHVLTLADALKKRGTSVTVMCAGGIYTKALKAAGIRVLSAPFKGRDPSSVIRSIRALRGCRADGYTVIHAHTRFTAALANFCLPHIPLVTTVHLNFSLSFSKRVLTCWGRKSLAVSPDLKDYLVREYGVCATDVSLTKNAVDPELFPLLPMRGRDIIHVSRLDKERSLSARLLCEIAPAIHRRYPNCKIRIYGDGDDFEHLARAAKHANQQAGAEVVFLFGSTADVSAIMADGAVFIGVSRAMLEAACRGLPVILSGNDGYGGILNEESYEIRKNDNFCCRGCDGATAAKLYSDLCHLLDHACFCEKIRIRIASRVRCDYTPEHMAEDALQAYHGALRIGMIGYYGFGNFGDEMMLMALRTQLKAHGVKSVLPLKKRSAPGALSRRHLLHAIRRLRKCDYVLFGGGNLLQNETSSRSLLYYALLILLCRKKTLVGVGMGIGELRGKIYKALCGRLLRRFSVFYFRTEADRDYAMQLAPTLSHRMHVTCDPCLHLSARAGLPKRNKKILAIPKHGKNKAFLRYLKQKRNEGYEILPLCLFPCEDDAAAKKIALLSGQKYRTIQTAEDFFAAAEDAVLCVSERLHGAVFSLLAHTPCILFSGSKKCESFAKDVASVAERCASPTPIAYVSTKAAAIKKEREAKGCAFGFSEIIMFLRNR